MNHDERRALGAFVKTRRERVTPAQLGLNVGGRRRTPGLRREEVAYMAGVSVTWYTWIEQGRDINISEAVLESIARVLRLSAQEQAYLFTLAGKQPYQLAHASDAVVTPMLQQLLDHQRHYPAYLMGRYWEIVAWNNASTHLFGDFALLPESERNMVWYTCVRPETRALVVDWEGRAQRLVAEFRGDCAQYIHDAHFLALLEQLKKASTEFARWWSQHDVYPRDGGRRAFQHATAGQLAFEQTTLRISSHPELKLVIHIPLNDASTRAMQQLCGMDDPTNQRGSPELARPKALRRESPSDSQQTQPE